MAPPRATGREQPSLIDPDAVALQKRAAAKAAADEVLDGMSVGLGTGSTVAHLLNELAGRRLRDHGTRRADARRQPGVFPV